MRAFWILGDQLLPQHPALRQATPQDTFLFIESASRSSHLRYHQHKLVLLYSAMRHYAEELRQAQKQVWYHQLEDGIGDYFDALERFCKNQKPSSIIVMEPNEWGMQSILPHLAKGLGVAIEIIPSEQFLVTRGDFKAWAGSKTNLLMATHYQFQRKRLNILLDEKGKPEGGSWSFDEDNRKTANDFKKAKLTAPPLPAIARSAITQKVISQVTKHWSSHPGQASTFWLPVTRRESLQWLAHFIENSLPHFGAYEDVMIDGEKTLYHSVLSPLLNIGLLTPQECVEAALKAYQDKKAPLASVEGYVRQIIGWREFINGVYWLEMPEYQDLNFLKATRSLPAWIYSAKSPLNCVSRCIQQASETGYNHHIQRLMVLGNFFILSGCEPKAVLAWYKEMYVDAYDWVMQPNVLGLVLYADGGRFATKPYIAGSGYISRMSNYCAGCQYKPAIKTGPQACPFNYLYWNFFAQHSEKFKNNHRINMMVKTWEKKSVVEKEEIQASAKSFFQNNW